MRKVKEIHDFMFNFIDERAKKLISQKVARMNGDIRVAFDVIRSCFSDLQTSLMELEDLS